MADAPFPPALRERVIAAALAARRPRRRRAPRLLPWLIALALASAPLWAPTDPERDTRIDRGAGTAWRKLARHLTENLSP